VVFYFSLPYKQQVDKLFGKVEKLSNERETLKDQVSTLQSALQSHQQVGYFTPHWQVVTSR